MNAIYILGGVLTVIALLLTIVVPWYSRRQAIDAREHMERRVTEGKSDMKEIVKDAKEDMEKAISAADAKLHEEMAEMEAAAQAATTKTPRAIHLKLVMMFLLLLRLRADIPGDPPFDALSALNSTYR